MFNLAADGEKMQVDDPPVVFSSFRSVSSVSTPYKNPLPTPIQNLTSLGDNIGAVCAELPGKVQLGKAIWHSEEESPEDFWDRDFEVKETRCQNDMDEEIILGSPSWSPLSPFFPKRSDSAAQGFATPQIIETQHATPTHNLITESLLSAWLGTNVVVEAEWTIEPSKVCL